MVDGDSNNIASVGHRSWILDPTLDKTGFGFVSGQSTYGYGLSTSSMFIRSWNNNASYYGVAWPAQNMPIEYFFIDSPWSIELGYHYSETTGQYMTLDSSKVKVKLMRISDGKTWNFSEASADGYFNVSGGQSCLIVFRPSDITYSDGDQFAVTITGIQEEISETATVTYQVNFFSAK